MRIVIALAVLGLACGSAWAQDRGQEWMLNRMKERLGLSDEQFEKVKELYKSTREGEDKLQKEREDKLKELLNDEQKPKYEEFRRNPMGGGGGGRGPGGGGGMQGWMDRFLAPQIDQLKKELALTDEQEPKVKAHLDEFNERARARMDEMRQNGFQGLDWQEEMKKYQDSIKDLGDKVKQHLTDEQKPKFDKLMEGRANLGNWGGFGGGRGNPPRAESAPQRPPVDERVRRVMEALKMENAEEAAAVRDLVKKVVEAQYALEDYEREAKGKVDELIKNKNASDDDIKTRIDELRGGRRERDKALKDAQKALAEVVTYRQELELIKAGLLR